MVCFLSIVLLLGGVPPPVEGLTPTPEAWPSTFYPYLDKNGNAIMDENGDVNPGTVDVYSGSGSPSVYYNSDGNNLFFRLRLKKDNEKANALYAVAVGTFSVVNNKWDHALTIGYNGNKKQVYIAKKVGSSYSSKVIYTSTVDTSKKVNGVGVNFVNAGGNGYFMDFQVPINEVAAFAPEYGITGSTPLRFYFGTSASTNLTVINKDFMSGTSQVVDFSNSSTTVPSVPTSSAGLISVAGQVDPTPVSKTVNTLDVSEWDINVGGSVDSLSVSDVVAQSGATKVFTTDNTYATTKTGPIPLSSDTPTPVYLKITNGAETKYYQVNITKLGLSNEADLKSINGEIDRTVGAQSGAIHDPIEWSVDVDYYKESLAPSDVIISNYATKQIYSAATFDGDPVTFAPTGLPLNIGENTPLYTKVIAEDGLATKYYKLIINRLQPSNDARLISVLSKAYEYTGPNDGSTIAGAIPWDITVNSGVANEGLSPLDIVTGSDANVNLYSNSDFSTGEVDVESFMTIGSTGTTPAYIKVTALDGTVKYYVANITVSDLPEYTVSFNTYGGSSIQDQTVTQDQTAARPADNPVKPGYTFGGWYTDTTYATGYNFSTPITAATEVHAEWTTEPTISPTISPTTATFDKNSTDTSSGHYQDISVGLTLNGKTLSSIENGGTALTETTNYTVIGSTVTIKKEYLSGLGVGTTNLTFNFSDSSTKTLAVTVSDTTEPTISPTTATFDKNSTDTSAGHYQDISVGLTLNGKTLSSIENGGTTLTETTDYTVIGSTVTIKKEYLASLGVGSTNLTFNFSDSSTKTLAVTVSDTTEPTISPTTATFDKNSTDTSAGHYQDISVGLTLNGKTLSSIENGGTTLTEITDYTVIGSTVTIKKEYLASLGVGSTNLTFNFSDSSTKTLAVTVSDTTEPTISPTTATFDKNSTDTSAGHYQDISVGLTLNGKTLSSIENGGTTLTEITDYTKSGSTVTIKKEYLASLGVGTTNLTFNFSDSSTKTLVVTVSDTTEPTISPTTATFDKNSTDTSSGHYQDISVGLTLNGKTLSSIENGGTTLTETTDYTVIGSTVTIKKEYLAGLGAGTTNLTFNFSDSSTKTLAVTVSDTTTPSSPSGGGGGSSSAPASNNIKGNVIDALTGKSVKGIEASVVDKANGTKTVGFKSEEALRFKKADGTNSPWNNLSALSFSSNLAGNSDGTSQPGIAQKADGTIEVQNLANNSEASFEVTFDLGDGQKIIMGKINAKVSANGDIILSSTLIDPYGIISDAVTGEVIEGVHVDLYYADTKRNRDTGKIPDTRVKLPILPEFEPNDNKNPQYSDVEGSYAFMVFPNTDYYVVATREGYHEYISPTLTVELEIVKWDFRMNPSPKTPPISGVERLAGENRIDTAIQIAKATYPDKVKAVVLATSKTYPDALTGSVLAYRHQAPILLVGSSQADQNKILTYMQEYLEPTGGVYILGGTAAVSQEMENKIQQAGYRNIKRLGGLDRYQTALEIAEELNLKSNTPLFLASGENYPDALSISSIAAINQFPILLARKNGLAEEVKAKIGDLEPAKVFIIGLEGALSSNVETQIPQATVIESFNIIRIGGRDRYQTSVAAAKHFELTGSDATVGTGENFPDALAGSIYAAKYNAPILLVNQSLLAETKEYLIARKTTGIKIFGGESAVPRAMQEDLSKLTK